MGKEKYLKKIEEFFNKSHVVTFSSIKRIVKNDKYAKLLVHNMVSKGKINKLAKGYYTSYDNPQLAVFCFKPAYLGLQDALSFHNLWEQETIPVIITTQKIRQGIRVANGINILIRRIDKKYFFGFEYVQQDSVYYPYSNIEKTFIDMIYFKENITPEALKEFKKKINRKKLESYLKRYPKRFQRIIAKII